MSLPWLYISLTVAVNLGKDDITYYILLLLLWSGVLLYGSGLQLLHRHFNCRGSFLQNKRYDTLSMLQLLYSVCTKYANTRMPPWRVP